MKHLLPVIVVILLACNSNKPQIETYPVIDSSSVINADTGATSTDNIADTTPVEGSEALYTSQWEIVQVMGKDVEVGGSRKPSLELLPGQPNRVTGFVGCNRVTGTFVVREANKIRFSPLAATKMMCPDIDLERKILEWLGRINNYFITDQGELLLLSGKIPAISLKPIEVKHAP